MPGWLTAIIGIVVELIIGRLLPRTHAAASRAAGLEAQLASRIVEKFPQINFDCLLKVIPTFLDDLAQLAREGKLQSIPALVDVLLWNLTAVLRCQFDIKVGTQASGDLNEKLITCGVKAVLQYFQTKDIGKSITSFVSCLFGSAPNPPDGDNGGGGGGGGNINPTEPVLRDHKRCLS